MFKNPNYYVFLNAERIHKGNVHRVKHKEKTWIHQGNYEGKKIGFLIADKMGRRSRDESGLRDGITDKKRTTTTRDLSH